MFSEINEKSLMEVDEYCMICQEPHKMTSSCMQFVECRNCNRKGHLRLHCPQNNPLYENLSSGSKRKMDNDDDPQEVTVKLSKTRATVNSSAVEGSFHSTPDLNECIKHDLKEEYFEEVTVKDEFEEYDCKEEHVKDDVQEDNIKDDYVNEERTKEAKELEGSDERISLWMPQFTKIWQVRYESKTAVCPSDKCDCMIEFGKMKDHIDRAHPELEKDNILCNLCKTICLPQSLSNHACMVTTPLGHLLVESQPSLDYNSQFWKTEKNGTIYCPHEKCKFRSQKNSKKRAKIFFHITKKHPVLNTNKNIHCKFCKSIVSPSHIRSHMDRCSAAKPLLRVLPMTTSGLKEDFPDVSLLPGLLPVQIDSDGLDFYSAKLFLEAYLVQNFIKSKSSSMRCAWMYMNGD